MSQRVVSFHYTLKNKDGETLDSSRDAEPLSYVEGKKQIIRGLEDSIATLKTGDKKHVAVQADQAYGQYDETLALRIPLDQFPADEKVEPGDQFRVAMPGKEPRVFTVTDIDSTHVSVDGNHPLAGEDLFFDVEIVEARPATEEDLKDDGCCGHDHGEHGHDHHH